YDENVFRLDYYGTIAEVEQYVTEHLSGELTLESIAKQVYLNPSYLSTMYHKSTGSTLFKFIQKERISKSLYLLCNSTMSIKEISEAVGFKDSNYFSKVFVRENGCSPRQYLKKVAKGEILQGDLQNEPV
ncbi:MAG TPA: AraC family transcriptional regulator, partial [Lachnospiraceae bacterium]|nr:AraC family transcriptional regulator [Lachnospiraceae bacterium]